MSYDINDSKNSTNLELYTSSQDDIIITGHSLGRNGQSLVQLPSL